MTVVLGIDGGQTGTTAVALTTSGEIVGVGRGGPLRHHEETDAQAAIEQAFEDSLREALPDAREVALASVSVTGSSGLVDGAVRRAIRVDDVLILESDTFAALASGTGSDGGVGLIAGTGSVVLARGVAARRHVLLGGWGWLMGDQGGGYWIAVEALRAAARAEDRTGPPTALEQQIPTALGRESLREVYNLLTGNRVERGVIASLAPVVISAAGAGDAAAVTILEQAADHLCDLVVAATVSAPFLEEHERVVVPTGGVLRASGFVTTILEARLAERLPDFRVTPPPVPPAVGAAYLGLAALGVPVTLELRARVESSARSWPDLAIKTSPVPITSTTNAPKEFRL